MKEYQNQADYQNSVENIDELDLQENKINPQYYIHMNIVNIQNCLSAQNGDIKSGILRFMLSVRQLEGLLRARNGLSEKYEIDLKEYKNSQEFKDLSNRGNIFEGISKQDYDLNQKKYELLLKEVFANAKIIKPLKV